MYGINDNGHVNATLVYLIPLLTSIYNNAHVNFFVTLIKSVAYLITVIWLCPIILLLLLDLMVYIYRLSKASLIPSTKFIDLKSVRRQRRLVLYHSNSYFNFNNYIKNFHNRDLLKLKWKLKQQEQLLLRKNSADSLNSRDSVFDLPLVLESESEFDSSSTDLSNINSTQRNENDNGKLYLRNGKDHLHKQNRSHSVVFSVSN